MEVYNPPTYTPKSGAPAQGQRRNPPPRQANNQAANRRQQIVRRPTSTGEPLEGMNIVLYQGYLANFSLNYTRTGVARAKFDIIVPMPVYEGGQQVFEPNGQPRVRETTERCEAWGNIAESLAQVPEGTPIKTQGSNNKFTVTQPDNTQIWIKDVKVEYWDFI